MRRRDGWIAAAVIAVVVGLATGVTVLVLDAAESGVETREELRTEQAQQVANSMGTRIQAAFASLGGVYGMPGAWAMEPGSPEDTAALSPRDPAATTGSYLVDVEGRLVNGGLLRDPDSIGERVDRDGLDRAFAGETTVLSVAEGLTTTSPTLAVAVPVRDDAGSIIGAHVTEVEITADSAYNEEVAQLQVDDGSFSFIDEDNVVIASSDETLLGRPLDADDVAGLEPGFHRRGKEVSAVADVPYVDWRLVFQQSRDAFEGDLTTPLRRALLLLLGAGGLFCIVAVVLLLRRLAAAREEQQRLAEIATAREEFTSIVSHELRMPVAGLLGFLQTTIDHWDVMPEGERRRAVSRAYANARSLQSLTADVLDSASIEAESLAFDPRPVDLRSLVDEAVAVLHDVEPGRSVTVDAPPEAWVQGDPVRLNQVLANLLDNASRSSPPDSPIDVIVEPSDGLVGVSVRDRGPGIVPEERTRVFDKFTRGRSGVGRGSGLGLYISRHIVDAHGGEIEVVADDHPGATIRFTVPAATAPAEPVA